MCNETRVSKTLGIEYPTLQEPFGGNLSSARLMATVSNAGGLGGFGAYTFSPDEIIDTDREIKSLSGKPYNFNLSVSDSDPKKGEITNAQYEQVKHLYQPYFGFRTCFLTKSSLAQTDSKIEGYEKAKHQSHKYP